MDNRPIKLAALLLGTALFAGVVCSEPPFCAHTLTCIRTVNAIPNPKLRKDKVVSNLETSSHLDCNADRIGQLRRLQRALPFRGSTESLLRHHDQVTRMQGGPVYTTAE